MSVLPNHPSSSIVPTLVYVHPIIPKPCLCRSHHPNILFLWLSSSSHLLCVIAIILSPSLCGCHNPHTFCVSVIILTPCLCKCHHPHILLARLSSYSHVVCGAVIILTSCLCGLQFFLRVLSSSRSSHNLFPILPSQVSTLISSPQYSPAPLKMQNSFVIF